MLGLILPPIIVVAALGALFWIFYKKRGLVAKLGAVQKLSRTVRPPKFLEWSQRKRKSRKEAPENGVELRSGAMGETDRSLGESTMERIGKRFQSLIPKRKRRGEKKKEFDGFDARETRRSLLEEELAVDTEKRSYEQLGGMDVRKAKRPRKNMPGGAAKKRTVEMVNQNAAMPAQSSAEEKDQYEQILVERIALNPKDIEAYERLGDYYLEWQSYQDAKECYKQVLRLSPMNRRAKIRMRRMEKILG